MFNKSIKKTQIFATVEEGEVSEKEPLFDINHMYDDKNSSVEL